MKSFTRGRCLALVLMICISQTALLAHSISHIGKDRVKCVLCVCQAQQAHSLPVHTFHFSEPQRHFSKPDVVRVLVPAKNPARPYFQRAPPIIA